MFGSHSIARCCNTDLTHFIHYEYWDYNILWLVIFTYFTSTIKVWICVQIFAAQPHSCCVYLQSVSEKYCLFSTEAVCLHYVVQYVLPHLKKKKKKSYRDTVNDYLNSVQSPSAYCSFRTGRQTDSQIISGLNQSLWQSDGGNEATFVKVVSIFCSRLVPLCPFKYFTKLEPSFNEWHLNYNQ